MGLSREAIFELFIEESRLNLERMESALTRMHTNGVCADTTAEVFRYIHTLKGSSANFKCRAMAEFAHLVEELLAVFREKPETLLIEYVPTLFRVVDAFRQQLGTVNFSSPELQVEPPTDLVEKIDHLLKVTTGAQTDDEESSPMAESEMPWAVTLIPVMGLDRKLHPQIPKIVRQFMALGDAKIACDVHSLAQDFDPTLLNLEWTLQLDAHISRTQIEKIEKKFQDICDIHFERELTETTLDKPARDAMPSLTDEGATQAEIPQDLAVSDHVAISNAGNDVLRVAIEKIDALSGAVSELLLKQEELESIMKDASNKGCSTSAVSTLTQKIEGLRRSTQNVQSSVMTLRMVKMDNCFSRFHRLCLELGISQGKKVRLETHGGDTEIDKFVFDPISEALLHILRNAIDHGLSPPEERAATGKPEVGTIVLNASQRGGHVQVDVIDDGVGIDYTKLRVRMMQFLGDRAPKDPDITQLNHFIFEPGVSTRAGATDVSGRGVGLDVVKKNIESLDGTISVESSDAGTSFCLQVPLTLAILEGQLVDYKQESYVIPISFIVETLVFEPQKVSAISPGEFVYSFRGQSVALVPLVGSCLPELPLENSVENSAQTTLFDMSVQGAKTKEGQCEYVVIVRVANTFAAILIDRVKCHQQFTMKNLDDHFVLIPGFSGASILGDGGVVLVVDIVYQCRELQKNAQLSTVNAGA